MSIKPKVRQSNFELLRIICMFGVLTNHVIQNCYPSLHSGNFTIQNELRILLMNACIVAVNCFVMISGYFRIKQSVRSFLALYFQLIFYCGIFAIVGVFLGHETIIMGCLKTVFPFTHGGMWFMTAYLALFLIAPLLNAGYDALNKPHRCIMLGCLILVDMYIGYMHQCKEVTQDGYHVIHFITMYYVGMFLFDFKLQTKINWGGAWGLVVVLMTALHALKMVFFPISIIYSMRYNSPMVLLASFLIFQWVKRWKFQSSKINWIAVSVLSVYVVHSQPVVSFYFFNFLKDLSQNPTLSNINTFGGILLSMVILYILCVLIDKIRIRLCAHIVDFYTIMIERILDKFRKFIC